MPARKPGAILDELASHFAALPGVFSTPQWGGRAYKVGSRKKSKLLAFVECSDEAVIVSFKLPPKRAGETVDRHGWVEPHSFRTLGPAGWVTATVTTRRTLGPLRKLLDESREMHGTRGGAEAAAEAPPRGDRAAGRINRVMDKARDEGWEPKSDW